MARRPFQCSAINPYHVTARTINADWFALRQEDVWLTVENNLYFISHAFDVRIHGFVLMSNHFHLLITTPKANLSRAMMYFMRETSRWLTWASGRKNQAWGARFHRCEISSYHYFLNAYKYIYRNPVEAGLVEHPDDYRFSTLPGLLGETRLAIPLIEDTLLTQDTAGVLSWLRSTPSRTNLDAIRKALRRSTFTLPKIDSRNHPLEIDML